MRRRVQLFLQRVKRRFVPDTQDGGTVHILIVPPKRGPTLNFTLPGWVYNFGLGALAALAVFLIGGLILTTWMGIELRRLHATERENVALRAENQRIGELELELGRLDDLRRQVLELAATNPRIQLKSDISPQASRTESAQGAMPGSTPGTTEGTAQGATIVPAPAQDKPGQPSPPTRWPVEGGVVSKEYQRGALPDKEHHGIDIAASHGAPVRAAGSGTVAFAGRDSVFGQLVVIDHGRGLQSLYGHNSVLVVGVGDWVREGQQIARVGSTGESSAPHLHFEVRLNGIPVDPMEYLGRGRRDAR